MESFLAEANRKGKDSQTEIREEKELKLKVKRLYPEAKLPTYATEGAACFDISTYLNGDVDHGEAHVFSTGLAFEIPEDHVMLVFSRSGHGFKNDVRLSNCVGVMDSDYVGELKVKMACDKPGWGLEINAGERIAQAMVIPVKQVQFEEVDELKSTKRGDKGLGSTGR